MFWDDGGSWSRAILERIRRLGDQNLEASFQIQKKGGKTVHEESGKKMKLPFFI